MATHHSNPHHTHHKRHSGLLARTVRDFLKNKLREKPLLLALSGGHDSRALFEIFVALKISFHVAHVNHHWREESDDEAKFLKTLCTEKQIPFHLKTLNPEQLKGNLEDACRQERLKFFSECVQKYELQAVATAHHADDQAETVLKRCLEGASLCKLGGLKPTQNIGDLELWRPLLSVPKKKILDFLNDTDIQAFDDPTNQDERFLRSRMRVDTLPYLEQSFGKNITQSLSRLATESQELESYWEERWKETLTQVVSGPLGDCLDLSQYKLHPVEVQSILRLFLGEKASILSRPQLLDAARIISNKEANKSFSLGDERLELDRGRIFWLKGTWLEGDEQALQEKGSWGSWDYERIEFVPSQNSWQDLWKGKLTLALPSANLCLMAPSSTLKVPGKRSLDRWWTEHKIPAFLRSCAPVVVCDALVVGEGLSGKALKMASAQSFFSFFATPRFHASVIFLITTFFMKRT